MCKEPTTDAPRRPKKEEDLYPKKVQGGWTYFRLTEVPRIPVMSFAIELVMDEKKGWALECGVCPTCRGIFGVDVTFLEQVDAVVHCPICLAEVEFPDPDEVRTEV